MESEKSEIFQQTRRTVSTLIKDKKLSERSGDLPGANVELSLTLLGLMGDLQTAEATRRQNYTAFAAQLESKGRSAADVDRELEAMYTEDTSGTWNI